MNKKETVLSVLKEIRDTNKDILAMLKNLSQKPILTEAKPEPRIINDRFTDNEDGTITDKELKVTWVKDPSVIPALQNTLTFDQAISACENLSYAGYHSGWRMPTLKEEQSIRDYAKYDPAWDTNVFGGKHDDWYWTSTPCAWNKDAAWCVGSNGGSVPTSGKSDHNYVRPVRSSQC